MKLAAFLNVQYEGDDLLLLMLIVFNLIPVSLFLAVMSFTVVINFGVALIVQMSALVICLAWLVPSVILCSISAATLWAAMQITRFAIGSYVERSISKSITPHQKFQ